MSLPPALIGNNQVLPFNPVQYFHDLLLELGVLLMGLVRFSSSVTAGQNADQLGVQEGGFGIERVVTGQQLGSALDVRQHRFQSVAQVFDLA